MPTLPALDRDAWAATRAAIGRALAIHNEHDLDPLVAAAIEVGLPWWTPYYGQNPRYCPLGCGRDRHTVAIHVTSLVTSMVPEATYYSPTRAELTKVEVVCYGDGVPPQWRAENDAGTHNRDGGRLRPHVSASAGGLRLTRAARRNIRGKRGR